ncbi:hypothetical protein QTP81_13090 [Alteromonas sp. ASW11-36]|uniref:Uncharacterized protein n=1 Tax=Alteromonas arenosi TaxID=3055817 RepID=A0ABT7SZB6_9ALTE|nr:hypothetical protein [Alteromonas sp. ASW11-36]MDM7861531.1 hypothetical protein [Alteromonas sp. ASW11-36]
MTSKIVLLLVGTLCISACKSTKQSVVSHANKPLAMPETVYIVPQESNINVLLTELGYDGNDIAATMYQANLNASMQSVNYDPLAGLAGALIGGAILKNSAENSAIREKNSPVQQFLTVAEQIQWQEVWHPDWQADLAPSKPQTTHLQITPETSLSSDYRSLISVFFVEVYADRKELLYRNYFHLESAPLLDLNTSLHQLNNIDSGEIVNDFTAVSERLLLLVEQALETWSKRSRFANHSIRYKNKRGEFYSRGEVLQPCDGFITFRTLRGEIKQAPCIVAPIPAEQVSASSHY